MNHLNLLFSAGNLHSLELFQVADILLLKVLDRGVVPRVKTRPHRSKFIIRRLAHCLGERTPSLATIAELSYIPLIDRLAKQWLSMLILKVLRKHSCVAHLCQFSRVLASTHLKQMLVGVT